jgi:CotS family spore coat protein
MTSLKPASLLFPDLTVFFGAEPKLTVTRCRSAYLVQTRDGNLVVKPLRVGSGKAALTGKLLSANVDCPVLPGLVKPSAAGNYWWRHGNRYLITRQIPGREADYFQIADLSAAIRTMAQFHRYTQQIIQAQQPGWSLLTFDPAHAWGQAYSEMETCRCLAIRAGDSWSKQYLKLWYYFSNQACQAISEMETIPAIALKAICYHDWAHHNVIIDGDRAYLIDFDAMVVDRPTHDRANLISRYLRLHSWNNQALMQLLWNFDRFYPWLQGELHLLRVYLTFPYDYWMIGRQYYLEQQPWSARYFQDQWQRKIAPHQARERILDLLDSI